MLSTLSALCCCESFGQTPEVLSKALTAAQGKQGASVNSEHQEDPVNRTICARYTAKTLC